LIRADREAQEQTKAQAATEEFLAEALSDFEKFASLVDILTKDSQRIRFKPNAIQREWMANCTSRAIILKARQQGITTIEQIRDLFYFLTVPGARVVVVCQSVTGQAPLKQLAQNFRIMLESLMRVGMKIDFTTDAVGEWILADRDSSLRIIVAGASEASASKKGRAGTISRLHITECAFFEYADETLNALFECVPSESTGSEIVIESTANGATGFFYKQCQKAIENKGSYKLHFFPWYKTEEYRTPLEPGEVIEPSQLLDKERREREEVLLEKGVSQEQLKWYRAKVEDKGQSKTDQEYPTDRDTCFLVSGRQYFEHTVTTKLIGRVVEPIEKRDHDQISIWRQPQAGERYLISADTSEGIGLDASAAVIREFKTGALCATLHGQYTPWQLAEALAALGWEYNRALIAVERNNHGHSVLQAFDKLRTPAPEDKSRPYLNVYTAADEKAGWHTNPVTRPVMLDALEDAHRKGYWSTPCATTLKQIRNFVIGKNGKAQAASGEHDDLVIAEAISWSVRQAMPTRQDVVKGSVENYYSPLAGW